MSRHLAFLEGVHVFLIVGLCCCAAYSLDYRFIVAALALGLFRWPR